MTRSIRPMLAGAVLSLAAAACAPVTPPPGPLASGGGQCFFASTISGFKAAGATAVNVRSSTAGVYRVELAAPCPGVGAAEKVLLDSRAAGVSVCPGADVTVITSGATGPRTCPGRSIRKLAESEVAALPAVERP